MSRARCYSAWIVVSDYAPQESARPPSQILSKTERSKEIAPYAVGDDVSMVDEKGFAGDE